VLESRRAGDAAFDLGERAGEFDEVDFTAGFGYCFERVGDEIGADGGSARR